VNFGWMQDKQALVSPEITNVDRQQSINTVDVRTGRQSGIMHLHTVDMMRNEQRPPLRVNLEQRYR
jgi:hypothetical protein